MKPFSINKPWGYFRQFSHNEKSTVKFLFVEAGEELSLQVHKKRKEFWYIVSGNPELIIGDKIIQAKPGDEFSTKIGEKHRIRATKTNKDVLILEISYGDFDEEDIVRHDDKYGRHKIAK